MNKKGFAILLTIMLVMALSITAIFIVENKAFSDQIDTQQIGYTQAQYHMQFSKNLLQDIDIDPTVTDKITFENIKNHKIEAIIEKNSDDSVHIDLVVQSLLHDHIRLHKSFDKN